MEDMNKNIQPVTDADDSALRELFAALPEPEAEDSAFMAGMEARLDAVDRVRAMERRERRVGRRALAVAAFTGFVCGALFTLFMPVLLAFMTRILGSVAEAMPDGTVTILCWFIAAVLTMLLTLQAYSLARTTR